MSRCRGCDELKLLASEHSCIDRGDGHVFMGPADELGLLPCQVCYGIGGFTAPVHCPGRPLTTIEMDWVVELSIDWRDGQWMEPATPWQPDGNRNWVRSSIYDYM